MFIAKLNPSGSGLLYATYLGGSSTDHGHGIAVDVSGSAYVTGFTQSNDFPLENPFQPSFGAGGEDAFITKLNASGSALIYSTYLGGNGGDVGYSIAVDASGNAYLTGQTRSSNFPTMSPLQPISGGFIDLFVTKINPSGSALVYSTYLGGNNFDRGQGIAVDASGSAYVTGLTQSPDYPTQSFFQDTFLGVVDVIVTKVNPSGSGLVYSTYIGGTGNDQAEAIDVDAFGNAYITGGTGSNDYPTESPFQPSLGGGFDAFVTKLGASGSVLSYSTYLGGSSTDFGRGISLDGSGNAYVTGGTSSTNFPTLSPIETSLKGSEDAFVTKLNTSGSPIYSTYLGSRRAEGKAIAVDPSGSAYITGDDGGFLPLVNPFQNSHGGGGQDAFVSKLGPKPVVVSELANLDLAGNFTVNFGGTFSTVDKVRLCLVFEGDLWDPGESYFINTFGGQGNGDPIGNPPRTSAQVNSLDPGTLSQFLDGDFSGTFTGPMNISSMQFTVYGTSADPFPDNGSLPGPLSTINFGAVPIGGSATENFSITNPGPGDLTIINIRARPYDILTFPNTTPTQFSIVSPTVTPTSPLVLASGASQSITVEYNPTVAGLTNGLVEIFLLNDPNSCIGVVNLNSTGTPLNDPPVAEAGPDQTGPNAVECTSASGASVTLDGSGSNDPDNGPSPLSYSWTGPFPEGGGSASGVGPAVTLPLGTHTIVLLVSDGLVTATDSLEVTVEDTTPPVVTMNGASPDTVECGDTYTDPGATANDACDGDLAVTTLDSLDTSTPGNYNITYTATDASGNTGSATRIVVVQDTTPPVPDLAALADATGECSATISETPTATDNCEGTITGTTTDALTSTTQGTSVVTWTYDDGNGNTTTQTQNIVVDDVTAPAPDVATLPDATGECSATISETPTATDNCEGTITGTTTDALTLTTQGTSVVTWTFDDGNGNTTTQNIVVDDVTAPAPDVASLPDATGECSATISDPP